MLPRRPEQPRQPRHFYQPTQAKKRQLALPWRPQAFVNVSSHGRHDVSVMFMQDLCEHSSACSHRTLTRSLPSSPHPQPKHHRKRIATWALSATLACFPVSVFRSLDPGFSSWLTGRSGAPLLFCRAMVIQGGVGCPSAPGPVAAGGWPFSVIKAKKEQY